MNRTARRPGAQRLQWSERVGKNNVFRRARLLRPGDRSRSGSWKARNAASRAANRRSLELTPMAPCDCPSVNRTASFRFRSDFTEPQPETLRVLECGSSVPLFGCGANGVPRWLPSFRRSAGKSQSATALCSLCAISIPKGLCLSAQAYKEQTALAPVKARDPLRLPGTLAAPTGPYAHSKTFGVPTSGANLCIF